MCDTSNDRDRESADNEDTLAITPGGPRKKNTVRKVAPGEAVRRNEDGTYTLVREVPKKPREEDESPSDA